jgi:hypothetical protein
MNTYEARAKLNAILGPDYQYVPELAKDELVALLQTETEKSFSAGAEWARKLLRLNMGLATPEDMKC